MDRLLSENPLNAEPSLPSLASSYLTPTKNVFNRNHGEFLVKDTATYSLSIKSEVPSITLDKTLTYDDLEKYEKVEVTCALACAGNRRSEMDEEKGVEGLLWGGSAIANSHFSGPLLRQVLAQLGVDLQKVPDADDMHIHFETSQECEDAEFYGSSLPLAMALDPERPVLLATHMNGDALDEKHGKPCRNIVPGIIGARSVKWLERIIIRDRPSDNFYMTRDYKILPPDTTPETKEEDLKHVPPMMELPLNSEICEPPDSSSIEVGQNERSISVRGYALGAQGTPIASVKVALVPLPLPESSSPSSSNDEPENPELYRIRLAASKIPQDRWTETELVDRPPNETAKRESNEKVWGWTLFSTSLAVPSDLIEQAQKKDVQVALVAYATDTNGQRQELQTPYNLRGVAEASWTVSRIDIRTA